MRSQPSPTVTAAFTRAEWRLLMRLPGQVVMAATSAEADNPVRTVAEGLAGADAIAAGLEIGSPLVQAVVDAIDADRDPDAPVAEEFADRAAGLASVVRACRDAAAVLTARSTPVERDAYLSWVTSIATRVCHASRSGGLLGLGGAHVGASERQFLADISTAFGG
jgi:hypothetical protein